ncbi:MAG: methylmalonyl-CoA mutase family protein, partial [Caldanaerobacter sp.]
VESKEKIVVGVNMFQIEEEPPKNLLKVDPKVEELQRQKLKKLRKERDNEKVQKVLNDLKEACKGTDNLMPYILEAVKAYATLGEICGVMREVFGEYKAPSIF